MPGYRLFYTALDGHVRYATELHCESDDQVVETVSGMNRLGHGAEIWEGPRRLPILFPHPLARETG